MRKYLYLCVTALIAASCNMGDPSRQGITPCEPGVMWTFPSPQIPPYCPPCTCVPPEGELLSGGDLINIALCNNPLTKQTWALARAAAYNWRVAKSAYYPDIVFQEDVQTTEVRFAGQSAGAASAASASSAINNANSISSNSQTTFASNRSYTVAIHQLYLNYLLIDFGGRDATVEAARQALLAANWTNNREIQTVVLSVLQNYYNYIAAIADRDANIKNLEDARANSEAASKKFEVGLSQIVDVLQAKSEFVNAERLLQVAEGQVTTTMGQLATSLGFPAETTLDVIQLPENLQVEKIQETVEELMCEAREFRPDLAASYAQLKQSHQQVIEAVSASLPTISAMGRAQIYNFFGHTGADGHIYTGGLELVAPVFDGWYYYNNIRASRENESASDASLREMELTVYLDVWTSYTNLNTAVETVKYSNQLLDFTEQAYKAALANYKQGTGDFLNVLNTQESLANARFQWVQARTSWLLSLAQLAYATGRI